MKIISIDPAMNGVTGIIVADYDPYSTADEQVEITNFAVVDMRFNDIPAKEQYELRLRETKELCKWIKKEKPDLVICENFIMFGVQMGTYGQSFITSEMIGMITMTCWESKIPIIKPRPSEVRSPINEFYIGKDGTRKTRPRKFKPELTTRALKDRGFLVAKGHNKTHLVVGELEIDLSQFKVGAKNDHAIMALRHLLNYTDNKDVESIVETAEEIYNMSKRDLKKGGE